MSENMIMSEKKFCTISNIISIAAFFLAVVVFIMNFGFCIIDGSSMVPTMENGNVAMISVNGSNSVDYEDIIVLFSNDSHEDRVHNGFEFFKRSRIDNQFLLVKRVIGLPGDVIEIHDGYAWRNGEKLECPYTNGPTNGEFGPYVVEEDHIFCLGDNRDYSADSRSFGAFPMSGVVGKVLLYL